MKKCNYTVGCLLWDGLVTTYTDELGDLQAFQCGEEIAVTDELRSAILTEEWRIQHKHDTPDFEFDDAYQEVESWEAQGDIT